MAPSNTRSHLRSAAKPKHQQQPSRPRTAHKRVSYREASSDSSESDAPSSGSEPEAGPSKQPSPPPKRNGAGKRKATEPPMLAVAGKKKYKTCHDSENSGRHQHTDTPVESTEKIMPWATLPYQILVAIFDYASRPVVSDTFAPGPSMTWLLHSTFTCKAFAEPCLSALYFSPPLSPPSRAQGLIECLAAQDENSTFNYRAKIKQLEVEASSTLMHKYAGHEPIDLGRLVGLTPQLRIVGIHLLSDNPKYRKAAMVMRKSAGRSAYQQSIFSALQEHHTLLRGWTWNQSLAKQSCSLAGLKQIHTMSSYQTIRDLSFVNYASGPSEKGRRREDILEEAIKALPNLTNLRFRTSTIVNSRFMPKLPGHLRTLEIFDCSSLKSQALSNFLSNHGRDLKELVLDHNPSLNLSFMSNLGIDCPRLELLKMDLRYFNSFFTIRDSDPKYDSLFHDGENPMWPTSLQRLELYHLRRWSLLTAETFFSSLTKAAKSLSKLRIIKIKACLEESGWRDRIGFRDRWTEKMQHVFQRRSPPPNSNLRSIKAFKTSKKLQRTKEKSRPSEEQPNATIKTTGSRSSQRDDPLSNHAEISPIPVEASESESNAPLSRVRRSARVLPLTQNFYKESESSRSSLNPHRRRHRRKGSDDSSSEDSAIDDDDMDRTKKPKAELLEEPVHIQGMCDIVDVLIDNLRPTEEQLNEDDFLDDEVSGDEDWNGDDDAIGDGGYAW